MLKKTDENTLISIGKLFRVKKECAIKDEPINNALAFIAYADSLPDTIYNQVESECGIINNDEVSFLTTFDNTDEEISVMFHKDGIYIDWYVGEKQYSSFSETIKSAVENYDSAVKEILESITQKQTEDQHQKHKIAINIDFGGFALSNEALGYLKGKGITDVDTLANYKFGRVPRHDKLLIETIEALGEKASGSYSDITIQEIEENQYRITEYDGLETIETPSDINYITINE